MSKVTISEIERRRPPPFTGAVSASCPASRLGSTRDEAFRFGAGTAPPPLGRSPAASQPTWRPFAGSLGRFDLFSKVNSDRDRSAAHIVRAHPARPDLPGAVV